LPDATVLISAFVSSITRLQAATVVLAGGSIRHAFSLRV
jgi:hypothetical protein